MAVVVEIVCEACGRVAPLKRKPTRFPGSTKVVREKLAAVGWNSNEKSGIDICPDCWDGNDRSKWFIRKLSEKAKERDASYWNEGTTL